MRNDQKLAFLFLGKGGCFAACLGHIEGASAEAVSGAREIDTVACSIPGTTPKDACGDDGATTREARNPLALQLALFAAGTTAAMLVARGVRPHLVIGHSFGEIAALAHAGAFDWAEGARIVCDRTEALVPLAPADGAMLAVSLPAADVQETIAVFSRSNGSRDLVVAVENHDLQTIVPGPRTQLEKYVDGLRELGISTTFLASPYGFHHPTLAAAARELAQRLAQRLACRSASRALRHFVWSPILGRAHAPQDGLCRAVYAGALSSRATGILSIILGFGEALFARLPGQRLPQFSGAAHRLFVA